MKRGNDHITNTTQRQLLPSIDELLHGINTDIPSPMPTQNIIIPRPPELFTLEYEHASHTAPPLLHATPFIYENNFQPPRKKIKQQSPSFSLVTTQQFQETTVHATPQFIQEYGTVPPSPNSNEDSQRKKKKSHTLDLTVQQLELRRKEDKRRSYHYLPDDCIETLKNWFQQNLEHPYPSAEEKTRLCTETGLSVQQVSNWFANSRKRMWGKKDSK